MKLGVQILSLMLVTTVVACGRTETPKKKENKPATPTDDEDPVDTPKKKTVPTKGTTGASGGTNTNTGGTCAQGTSAEAYTGGVAGLRVSNRKSGAVVTLNNVVVTAIRGNGSIYYVADATDPHRGVHVACGKEECADAPKSVGALVNIKGTLSVDADCLRMRITKPTMTSTGSTTAVNEVSAAPAKLSTVDSTDLFGTKVKIQGSTFRVASTIPNPKWDAKAEAECADTSKGARRCCSVAGAKYIGYEVEVNGVRVLVNPTIFYPGDKNAKQGVSPQYTAWACDGDMSNVVKVGDTFTRIAGIFDIDFGKPYVFPTLDSDFSKSGGTTVPTGNTGPSGSSGTSSPDSCCTCSGSVSEYEWSYSCTCDCPGGQQPLYCTECTIDANCGGEGNFCLLDDDNVGRCGKYCESDADCPMGDVCYPIYGTDADDNVVFFGTNCFPESGYCPAR